MEIMLKDELVPGNGNIPATSGLSMEVTTAKHHDSYVQSGQSKRVGLIGKKIGMTLQWLKDGTRILCTMIHCPDNHIISVMDPGSWYNSSIVGKQKAFGWFGPKWRLMVGAFDDESVFYSDEWRSLFRRAGVPTKEIVGGFTVTEDAILERGTKLDVRHFQVGQHVSVSGKTIDYGFQGVMRRWGMKGQKKLHTTKSHRRVGAIGVKGEAKVWPGRCLPGHMGYEWRHAVGLEVVRINPIKQVIYVKGCVPGDQMETLHIKDCIKEDDKYAAKDPKPPFPTYLPSREEDGDKLESDTRIHLASTSKDIYAPTIFQFNMPSIVYTEADETKSQARDKTKAKTAKVKR